MNERVNDVVDVAFAVAGVTLPRDYAFALFRAVVTHLPWFETEQGAGIHPLRGAPTDYGVMLLPRRARLVLRLPRNRVADASALTGRTMSIGGRALEVGVATVRELQPYGALYAHLVATGCDEEQRFLAGIASQLKALAAQCALICGRRRSVRAADREVVGFGLMLHELVPEQSLLLQRVGLGAERRLGCGILVPHRLAAAVGSA
jgi:CRISPR-associated protein Cas6